MAAGGCEKFYMGDRTYRYYKESDRDLYLSDESTEDSDYRDDGYYVVAPGDALGPRRRYHVLRKTGYGSFSTLWLCSDTLTNTSVSIKISKGSEEISNMTRIEGDMLIEISKFKQDCQGAERIVKLLDRFEMKGPNGRHVCLVFETFGCTLRRHLSSVSEETCRGRVGVLPLTAIKTITKQVLQGLKFLHENCKIIHGDIQPDTVLLRVSEKTLNAIIAEATSWMKNPDSIPNFAKCAVSPKRPPDTGDANPGPSGMPAATSSGTAQDSTEEESDEEKTMVRQDTARTKTREKDKMKREYVYDIAITEFGCSFYSFMGSNRSFIQTWQYRPPEVILGICSTFAIDIWSLGCMIFEMATGARLFDSRVCGNYRDKIHILYMIQCLGNIPESFLKKAQVRFWIQRSEGERQKIEVLPLKAQLTDTYGWDSDNAEEFSNFLLWVMNYDNELRPTAAEILQHPWLNS